MVLITPFYAALLTLIYVFLSVNTLLQRRRANIPVGDGADCRLLRRIRAHGNVSEYVPLGLIMTAFTEVVVAQPALIHVIGLCLLFGRVSHAFGISQVNENYRYRVAGMALTFTSLLLSASSILLLVIMNSIV
jgi:uncharacterized membrane protein YecN with MAPEG domain